MNGLAYGNWKRADDWLRWLAFGVGVALIVYVAMAVGGLVESSARHYTLFTWAVMIVSGVTAIRNVIVRNRLGRSAAVSEEAAVEDAPLKPSRFFWSELILAIAATIVITVTAGYIWTHANRLEMVAPDFTDLDMAVGILFTLTVLVLTWMHWGMVLTVLIGLSILYFFYGHNIENYLLSHPQYEPTFVMNYVGLGVTQGFFWFAQTAVDDIFFLVVYAATLFGLGMLYMIVELGKITGNKVHGGAAGPAILGSGVVAAVMGTAVSNVVLVGRFTVPMMIKYGYKPGMAAAIEATASTSGQIMPPVLGLAAFLIAGLLGIAYVDVVKAAVIPGLLYMTGVTIGVAVYARKNNLPKLNEVVNYRIIGKLLPTFVLSFLTVVVLLVNYFSPSVAGMAGTVVALALSLFQGEFRPKWKNLVASLDEGLVLVALLSLLLIAIGPLGQAFQTTNLSGKLGVWLVSVLPPNQLLLLIGAAVISLILGMGLPTPVAYLVVALAMVPFMQQIGVAPLQAHYFVFYFAVYSALSPPVAVAALAAAKIAGSSFYDAGLHSMKLAATTFIIPFAFVYRPELMMFPNFPWTFWPVLLEVLLIQWVSSIALYGYFRRSLSKSERWAFALLTLVGYWAIIDKPFYATAAFIGGSLALMAFVSLAKVGAPAKRSSGSVMTQGDLAP